MLTRGCYRKSPPRVSVFFIIMFKTCTSCFLNKPLNDFNKGNSRQWKESRCKECKSKWRITNKEYLKSYEASDERRKKHLEREERRRYLKKINSDGTIPRDLKQKHKLFLLNRQAYLCWITWKSLIVDGVLTYHVDHKIPLIKWGKHSIDNVHLVLPKENLKKWTNSI